MPSCGVLRRETRPQHAETETTWIVRKNLSGYQRRVKFVNQEVRYPCEPLRFARRLFPLAAAARKDVSANLTNRTPRAGSDSLFPSKESPVPPAGTAILRNRNGPRVGNVRARCGVHALILRRNSMLCPARLFVRARLGFRRSWLCAALGWDGLRQGRCPCTPQGG